jgi:hypothetical protein
LGLVFKNYLFAMDLIVCLLICLFCPLFWFNSF